MKKLFFFLLCLPLLVSCGNDDDNGSPAPTEKTITYKFSSNNIPTGSNNLIGVQVYKEVQSSKPDEYSPYAYGLFDDISKIKLEFPKGASYKIVSTVIVNGKKEVAQDASGYLKPFAIREKGVALTNSFELSSVDAMLLLNQSTTTMVIDDKATKSTNTQKDYEIPPLDRYYGETTTYNGDSGDNPIVNMDRYVFGLRMNVSFTGTHIVPTDCILLIVDGSPDTLKVFASDEVKTIERIYTYSNLTKEETPRSIKLKVFYKGENGDLFEFSRSSNEDLYRNSLMILNQTVFKDGFIENFPFYWEGIDEYYGEGGY